MEDIVVFIAWSEVLSSTHFLCDSKSENHKSRCRETTIEDNLFSKGKCTYFQFYKAINCSFVNPAYKLIYISSYKEFTFNNFLHDSAAEIHFFRETSA